MAARWIYAVIAFVCLGLNPAAEADSLSGLFKKVNPSVVIIQTTVIRQSGAAPGGMVAEKGLGSGFVVSDDGLVMTAAHVVHQADQVIISFLDGASTTARVISSSPTADVALVQLDSLPSDLMVAKLGDSDKIEVGDQVFVVGAPYGIAHTLTVGHISGRRKSEDVSGQFVPVEYLQTDASVNQGNSGGPMFNMKGEVVGVVSSILSQSGGFEGIGFAASINIARKLLLEQRTFWTGLDFYLVSGVFAQALNIPQEAGLLLQRVTKNSPGARVGFQAGHIPIVLGDKEILIGGDIVLRVQGIPISTDIDKLRVIRDTVAGTPGLKEIDFTVLRGGKILNLCVSCALRP